MTAQIWAVTVMWGLAVVVLAVMAWVITPRKRTRR